MSRHSCARGGVSVPDTNRGVIDVTTQLQRSLTPQRVRGLTNSPRFVQPRQIRHVRKCRRCRHRCRLQSAIPLRKSAKASEPNDKKTWRQKHSNAPRRRLGRANLMHETAPKLLHEYLHRPIRNRSAVAKKSRPHFGPLDTASDRQMHRCLLPNLEEFWSAQYIDLTPCVGRVGRYVLT